MAIGRNQSNLYLLMIHKKQNKTLMNSLEAFMPRQVMMVKGQCVSLFWNLVVPIYPPIGTMLSSDYLGMKSYCSAVVCSRVQVHCSTVVRRSIAVNNQYKSHKCTGTSAVE